MGGGQVRATHLLVHGVDLVEETLFTAVGIPNRPFVLAPPGADGAAAASGARGGGAPATVPALAYNYVVAPTSGVVGDVGAALGAVAERDPDVVYAKPLVATGAAVVGPKEGLPTWIADIMVSKPTPQEALDAALALSDALEVPMS